jgi:hypothetical protein
LSSPRTVPYRGLGVPLWETAGAAPTLDLNFAENRTLLDSVTGQNLITFTRASSGTYVDADGLIKTAANNVPRFDHNPVTGECLGLLVEEQRTNLMTASEAMHTSPWGPVAATVIANDGVAPDVTTTADKIISTGGGNFRSGISIANATTYTYSVFLKSIAGTGVISQVGFERFGSTPLAASVSVNLSAGTVTSNGAPVIASSITRYPNDWYRVSVTAKSTDATTTIVNYAAASGNEFLVWGAQLEAGAFPTSYIPTTAATVTRSADVASISGSNFSAWYRQDQGSLFVSASAPQPSSGNRRIAFATDGTGNNRVGILFNSTNNPQLLLSASGTITASISSSVTATGFVQSAAGYALDDFAYATSGLLAGTDTSGAVPSTVDRLSIGSQDANDRINGTIRRLVYWGQRLPNSTLQAVTQ